MTLPLPFRLAMCWLVALAATAPAVAAPFPETSPGSGELSRGMVAPHERVPARGTPSLRSQRRIRKGGVVEISAGGGWLYYREHIDLEPIVSEYRRALEGVRDELGERRFRVDSVFAVGYPKSNEYGPSYGVSVSYRHNALQGNLFLRPFLGLLSGPRHVYDGSTQAYYAPPDTVDGKVLYGVYFDPVKGTKSNWFLRQGVGLGLRLATGTLECELGVGLEGRLWIRYLGGVLYKEHYRWWRVPAGVQLWAFLPGGRRWGVSFEGVLMPRGEMDVYFDRVLYNMVSETSYDSLRSAPVVLGNRSGLNASVVLERTVSDALALTLRPWVEWYRFGQSTTTTLEGLSGGRWVRAQRFAEFLEPASTTWWWGLDLGVSRLVRYR